MKKKILFIVNYYYPYISGLSETVRILAEYFAEKGHEVTVLCENHNSKEILSEEIINKVRIVRAKILFKINKGMVSTDFIFKAIKISNEFDVINMHIPMLEAGLISTFLKKKRIITTYHCDIDLEKGIFNSFIKIIMNFSNSLCLKNSYKILNASLDYGKHSKLASRYAEKLVEVGTTIKEFFPVEIKKNKNKKIIGFCGRIVMEKGIDVLIKAYQIIQTKRNDVELLIGGDYKNIAGGSIYPKLKKFIKDNNLKNIRFLGKISDDEMQFFYSSLDVFVLPSVNPLEAFGLVQVEAMLSGTPVVSSDLYGVRTIVQNTGMGLIHERGNANQLAECILKILEDPSKYTKTREEILKIYNTKKCALGYETYFDEAIKERNDKRC